MDRDITYKEVRPTCCECGCELYGEVHEVNCDLYCNDCFETYIEDLKVDTVVNADDYVEEELH